jgi:hypothetical protein
MGSDARIGKRFYFQELVMVEVVFQKMYKHWLKLPKKIITISKF